MTEEEAGKSILIVGDLTRWTRNGRETQGFDSFHFTSFAELTEQALHSASPEIVLSPLMADHFDAMDVAYALQKMQFKGLYRAIAMDNINPAVICADVRTIAPDVNFDVLAIPDLREAPALKRA